MVDGGMSEGKLRHRVAWEAARLIYGRHETDYHRAKLKAAQKILRGEITPNDLPGNREIREQIQALARLHEGRRRTENLHQMRVAALTVMQLLREFHPRLVGSVLVGHIRKGCGIDLHVFCDSVAAIRDILEAEGVSFEIDRKRTGEEQSEQPFTRLHVRGRFPVELRVYPAGMVHCDIRNAVVGRVMERASIAELESLIEAEHPEMPWEAPVLEEGSGLDRFQHYESLLLPLEHVKQNPASHPEGDVLYHSLQVFVLAGEALPYDEEFLLAALLHDVGMAIDRKDHVGAALEALDGHVTGRTAWLIEHRQEALVLRNGRLGLRARRRLEASEDFDELRLLAECDSRGRCRGVAVPQLEEALESIRTLARLNGE